MSAVKQQDSKRYIGYQNDLKKHQNHHISNTNQTSADQKWQNVQEHQNTKKKQNGQQLSLTQLGANSGISHQQINNQYMGEFIPQKATDQAKKEKRNKDRLSHLSKLLPQKARWIGYLDVGCGNAEITATIAQYLGIGNVFGVDMFDEDDFVQPSMDLEVKYIQNAHNKIKLPANSVDLITCFMAIHHFEHLDQMLREIQRVLLIDGYIFIREHDVPQKDKQLKTYIEEQHRKYPDHPADGYMMLYDREELKDILFAYGFEHLGDSNYTGQNLQAVYHSLYILKRKEVNPNAKQLIRKNKNQSLSESLDEEEDSSNNQSINSEDAQGLNQLSLSDDKNSSSTKYNRKEIFEQLQQISLQQQSDSISSSELEKDTSPIEKKYQIHSTQKFQVEEKSLAKKQPTTNKNQTTEKIPNLLKKSGDQIFNINRPTQLEVEEVDAYASIITIPPQKKETNQAQQKQQQQKKPIVLVKTNEKAQIQNNFNQQESSPLRSEKQKIQVVDDDGFVIVGKQAKKQQQMNGQKTISQTTQVNKKQESINKKESDYLDIEEEGDVIPQKKDSEVAKEEDEDNSSFSNNDQSNQFIIIKSKKQKKNKNHK